MNDQTNWRPVSPEEAGVIRSILSQANNRSSGRLITDLDGARRQRDAVDTRRQSVEQRRRRDLPNGPFPAQAFVPNSAEYQGEVIIWITMGRYLDWSMRG
jgi:hypothetical protein